MKRLVISIAALCAWVGAAHAQVSMPFPGPGGVSITPLGTPATLGSVTSTANANTAALTASAAIQGGDLIVCFVSNANLMTVSSVSDGTNSYSQAVSVGNNGANSNVGAFWYVASAAAVASPTITATFSATNTNVKALDCARVAGTTASPLDKTNSGTSGAGGAAVATGTLSQATEVIFGAITTNNTITASSGFTQLNTATSGAFHADIEYQVVASTSTVTFQAGTGGSGSGSVVATFKGN